MIFKKKLIEYNKYVCKSNYNNLYKGKALFYINKYLRFFVAMSASRSSYYDHFIHYIKHHMISVKGKNQLGKKSVQFDMFTSFFAFQVN